MPTGYRCIVLAAVGWLALTGQKDIDAQRRKAGTDATEQRRDSATQEAANTIAEAISNAVRPAAKDEGCPDRGDKRESELCAQWGAADAARDAAKYALWTLIISGIGTGLLVWTLWETRANARRELRAYVSVKIASTSMTFSDRGVRVTPLTLAHNGGSTPAYDCVSFANVIAVSPEEAAAYLSKPLPIEKEALDGGSVVHSGEELPLAFNTETVLPMSKIDDILIGRCFLYVYGVASYVDTFGVRRRTDFCVMLPHDQFRSAYLEGKAGAEVKEVNWKIAQFHNKAT